jgi:hypothetical protein
MFCFVFPLQSQKLPSHDNEERLKREDIYYIWKWNFHSEKTQDLNWGKRNSFMYITISQG